jgi:hypothetical protein
VVSSAVQAIFSDTFAGGSLSGWTGVTRVSIDTSSGSAAPPSARAQVSGQSAYAYKNLASTASTVCAAVNVDAASVGSSSIVLFRLRTAANGPVIRVALTSARILTLRADVSGATRNSRVSLGTGWHEVELCGTVGPAWDLSRDGVTVVDGGWPTRARRRSEDRDRRHDREDVHRELRRRPRDGARVSRRRSQRPRDHDGRPGASDTVIPSVMPSLRQWMMTGGQEFTELCDAIALLSRPVGHLLWPLRAQHRRRTNPDGAALDHSQTMERLPPSAGTTAPTSASS